MKERERQRESETERERETERVYNHTNHNRSLRDHYFDKITQIFPEFHHLNDLDRLSDLLGEGGLL